MSRRPAPPEGRSGPGGRCSRTAPGCPGRCRGVPGSRSHRRSARDQQRPGRLDLQIDGVVQDPLGALGPGRNRDHNQPQPHHHHDHDHDRRQGPRPPQHPRHLLTHPPTSNPHPGPGKPPLHGRLPGKDADIPDLRRCSRALTGRTGGVSPLIRRLQVRVLPGRRGAGQRLAVAIPVRYLWTHWTDTALSSLRHVPETKMTMGSGRGRRLPLFRRPVRSRRSSRTRDGRGSAWGEPRPAKVRRG